MYIYMCVCVCVCIYIYIYVYVCVCLWVGGCKRVCLFFRHLYVVFINLKTISGKAAFFH